VLSWYTENFNHLHHLIKLHIHTTDLVQSSVEVVDMLLFITKTW